MTTGEFDRCGSVAGDATAPDILGAYIRRLKESNEKLRFWRRHTELFCDAAARFTWLGVALWDLHIGRLAPLDVFAGGSRDAAPAFMERPVRAWRRVADLCRRFTYMPRVGPSAGSFLFVAYQRRQISSFVETMQMLRHDGYDTSVATTCVPGSRFTVPPPARQIAAIESFLSPRLIAAARREHERITRWLRSLDGSLTPPERYELGVIVSALEARLMYSLLVLGATNEMLHRLRPRCIVTADDSDMRARAACLIGRHMRIPSFHLPYAYLNFDCYEESYPSADVKLVFGPEQRRLIVDYFGVASRRVEVLGAPRFDTLFGLRRPRKASDRLSTILLGSQTHGTSTYSPLTSESKTSALSEFFAALRSRVPPLRVLYRPHPEETPAERAAVHSLAAGAGISLTQIDALDFRRLAEEVDLFVTFFSTLALEFLILGIPVCYLTTVSSIAVLRASCEAGVAREVLSREAWETLLGARGGLTGRFVDSTQFLNGQFENAGNASAELAARLRRCGAATDERAPGPQ